MPSVDVSVQYLVVVQCVWLAMECYGMMRCTVPDMFRPCRAVDAAVAYFDKGIAYEPHARRRCALIPCPSGSKGRRAVLLMSERRKVQQIIVALRQYTRFVAAQGLGTCTDNDKLPVLSMVATHCSMPRWTRGKAGLFWQTGVRLIVRGR